MYQPIILNDLTFLFQVCSPGMKRHAMSTLEENWRSSHLWHLLERNVGVVCTFLPCIIAKVCFKYEFFFEAQFRAFNLNKRKVQSQNNSKNLKYFILA